MWLNDDKLSTAAINGYRQSLRHSCPNHVVIDGLFNEAKLDDVVQILQHSERWQIQRHTYSALYVDNEQWQNTAQEQRFVQRDVWQRETPEQQQNSAQALLSFLRGDEFMALLSRIFKVHLTDINVADPAVNSNYFRLGVTDFVEQHADDSPGREVCMLLYLNKTTHENVHSVNQPNHPKNRGGELCFKGLGFKGPSLKGLAEHHTNQFDNSLSKEATPSAIPAPNQPITIAPIFNRCVLFDPSSAGSEHWVAKLGADNVTPYRYNVTSWYWSV